MINITENALHKMKEVLSLQAEPCNIRISVQGQGCSGFGYKMALETETNLFDKTYDYNGMKVVVDQASLLYLDGVTVDYLETLESSGFKFDNPLATTTCGCGNSFSM